MNGTVIRLKSDKQFGFIRTNEGGEYFFHRDNFSGHWNDLVLDYQENKVIPVEFESVKSTRGPRAESVKRTDFPNQAA